MPPTEPLLAQLSEDPLYPGLRRAWLKLALGVTVHRYFLHIEPALTNETGLNLSARRAVAQVRTTPNDAAKAFLQKLRIGFGDLERAPALPRSASIGTSLLAIVELGILAFVSADQIDMGPDWRAITGYPAARGNRYQDRQTLVDGTVAGVAARNIFLAFLYAGRREAGDPTDLETIARELEREHGRLADDVAAAAAALMSGATLAAECRRRIDLGAERIEYIPASDFARTVCESEFILRKYAIGLGVGQS